MSTAEDVFYLYERNSRAYYHNCEEFNMCRWGFCCSNENIPIVKPITIGDQYVPCNIKYKCYIRPGQECPVCFDPIINKTTAFITSCGHSFHKKCLFNYIKTKWETTSYLSKAGCPICRCSLGFPTFIERYTNNYFNSTFYEKQNKLDELEDFWLSNEYRLPEFCQEQYNHYLGMNSRCRRCVLYRKFGKNNLDYYMYHTNEEVITPENDLVSTDGESDFEDDFSIS